MNDFELQVIEDCVDALTNNLQQRIGVMTQNWNHARWLMHKIIDRLNDEVYKDIKVCNTNTNLSHGNCNIRFFVDPHIMRGLKFDNLIVDDQVHRNKITEACALLTYNKKEK